MDPKTGKVLSMVGFDKTDPSNNPCVDSRFPAASIFKIVTASAVVEKCGFQPGSKLSYNGRKHTLYKSQLKDRRNRYTNRITFRDSFAQSVNPVFGKIGAHYLGKIRLKSMLKHLTSTKISILRLRLLRVSSIYPMNLTSGPRSPADSTIKQKYLPFTVQ